MDGPTMIWIVWNHLEICLEPWIFSNGWVGCKSLVIVQNTNKSDFYLKKKKDHQFSRSSCSFCWNNPLKCDPMCKFFQESFLQFCSVSVLMQWFIIGGFFLVRRMMNVALKVGNSNLYKSAAENEFRALLSKQVSATPVSWVLAETVKN